MDSYTFETKCCCPEFSQHRLKRRARRGIGTVKLRLALRRPGQVELLGQTQALWFTRRAYRYGLDKDDLTWDFIRCQAHSGESAQLLFCSPGIVVQDYSGNDILSPTNVRHPEGH